MHAEWMDTMVLLIKSASVTLLCLLTYLFLKGKGIQGRVGAILTVSVIAYILVGSIRSGFATNPWLLPLRVLAVSVSFWFYLFSRLLFDERYRPRQWVWMILVAQCLLLCLSWLLRTDRLPSPFPQLKGILILIQQILSIGIVVTALVFVQRDFRADLWEKRRALRIHFTTTVGGYAILVIIMEVYLRGICPPLLFDLIQSIMMLLVVIFVTLMILGSVSLFSVPLREINQANQILPVEREQIEGKLKIAMGENELFRIEGLTITELAKRMNVQEYKLRRVINFSLEFRNFNEFLNSLRIEEAKKILGNSEKNEIPILRIAMDLGYRSLATFNRAFLSICGMTPTEFRQGIASKN